MTNPIRPTNDDARALAQTMLTQARTAALGVLTPDTSAPMVTRAAVLWHDGSMLLLVSVLSSHTAALKAHPQCSLLVGEPGAKGDPLTHPRITLQAVAELVDKRRYRDVWLAAHPKSKLYFDFADFRMMQLSVSDAHLNGGFGKAFRMTSADLGA